MELLETLLRKMRKGIVDFSYLKKNGQKRKASGTLYGIGHTIKITTNETSVPIHYAIMM